MIFHIQNYHFELRTRVVNYSVPDGRGGSRMESRTETYWERVNTHSASEAFRYMEWADTSPDKSSLDYVSMIRVTRLRFYQRFEFSTTASASLEY